MNNIDLIPLEYHRKRLFSGWLKIATLVVFALTALIVSVFAILRYESANMQQKIDQLQAQKAISNNHREQLQQLNQKKEALQQQLKLLAGLRSGESAETMFDVINRAMPGQKIWINRWGFRRAGTPVDEADRAVNTGYFIVIPQGVGKGRKPKPETWKIETQMTLQGQAFDYEALSDFVLNLTRRPEIDNVRVVTTRMTQLKNIKLVDFSLEVIVSAGAGEHA
jgi:Tfp pilus assembly protein PilN